MYTSSPGSKGFLLNPDNGVCMVHLNIVLESVVTPVMATPLSLLIVLMVISFSGSPTGSVMTLTPTNSPEFISEVKNPELIMLFVLLSIIITSGLLI